MFGNYNPYMPRPFTMDPQRNQMQLIRVTGMEGAKAYQMPPNSVVPLFDADNDIMYVKSTDGAGTVPVNIPAIVRNQCCDSTSTLTIVVTSATVPATVTIDNTAVVVTKL